MKILLMIMTLLLSGATYAKKPKKQQKDSKFQTAYKGIVASDEVEFGIMMTIRGKTSVARFVDKDANKVCYLSFKHQTDELQAMSCLDYDKSE